METMMEGAPELFPLPARVAPFLGRQLQQDALYRTIPGTIVSSATVSSATCRREAGTTEETTTVATAATVLTRAEGGAQILTYPEARQTPDMR
jgi:hypothetical protein